MKQDSVSADLAHDTVKICLHFYKDTLKEYYSNLALQFGKVGRLTRDRLKNSG